MIGQILGGSSPHVAIKYQIMIVVITVVASMLSLMMTIFSGLTEIIRQLWPVVTGS